MIIALRILLVGSRKPTSYRYSFLLTNAVAELRRGAPPSSMCAPTHLRETGRKPAHIPQNVRFQNDMETK
jgi:hypothetical protein